MKTTRRLIGPIDYLGIDLSDRYAKHRRPNDVCGLTEIGCNNLSPDFGLWEWSEPEHPIDVSEITEEIDKAQDWRWCSLWRKVHGDRESLLSDWSFYRPANWVEWVNTAQTEVEIEALRRCVNRGTPYGTETWKTKIVATLGLGDSGVGDSGVRLA